MVNPSSEIQQARGRIRLEAEHISNRVKPPSQLVLQTAEILASRRVLHQLINALLFERLLHPILHKEQEKTICRLTGKDATGQSVIYEFEVQLHFTFDMLRISGPYVWRRSGKSCEEALNPLQFLDEVFSEGLQKIPEQKRSLRNELNAPSHGDNPLNVSVVPKIQRSASSNANDSVEHYAIKPYVIKPSFRVEIERTLQHEIAYQRLRLSESRSYRKATLYELEGRCADGHPYHPCFRSRLGFQMEDNAAYGPEYEPHFPVFWIAAYKEDTQLDLQQGNLPDDFYSSILKAADTERFEQVLLSLGLNPDHYTFIPVHPWQWQRHLRKACSTDIRQQRLVPLGYGTSLFTPQQSIRTLSSLDPEHPLDLKLSLHIVNTSSLRDLSMHSVAAAPAVSAWLQSVIHEDPYLKFEARPIVLQEVAGLSYLPAHGAASCIWRESISCYLEPGEEAIPFYVLMSGDTDGSPFLAPWITRYGLKEWFSAWIRQAIIPVVHLLVGQGIVLESHAQNMLLIHRQGWPVRVALRDFHEGVEYYLPFLARPDLLPDFARLHPVYANTAPGEHFAMDSLASLREMMIDALWCMNVGYIIMRLSAWYAVKEEMLWKIIVDELEIYQERHQHLKERFDALNLFIPFCEIEPLTQKRMLECLPAHTTLRQISNPLYKTWRLQSSHTGD